MMPRGTKLAANSQGKQQLSREMRQNRLALFIQQVEKQAQERLSDLEAKLENQLATVDRAFKVELMKMPPSLQNTLMGDLICEEELSASEVSIAINSESREMAFPPRRMPRRQVKSTNSPPVQTQRPCPKTQKGQKGTRETRLLVGSNSTGSLTAASAKVKRTRSHLTNRKTPEEAKKMSKLRSVVSAGDLHCSMAGCAAHITVTTARGQMVSFSEETKDLNLDLLDDVAWSQVHRLSRLMGSICHSRSLPPMSKNV